MKRFVLLFLVFSMPAMALPLHSVGCAPTMESAVEHLLTNTQARDVVAGFRVNAVRVDHIRSKSYAMVSSCNEPSRPLVAIELPGAVFSSISAQKTIVVHAGDRVTVVAHRGDSQMQLTGWAEETGAVQQSIRVRLASFGSDQGSGAQLQCVIVRQGWVEVKR